MWGKVNRFVHSHTIPSVISLGILFPFALLIIAILLIGVPQDGRPPGTSELSIFTMIQLILAVVVIWLMKKLGVYSADDFKSKI